MRGYRCVQVLAIWAASAAACGDVKSLSLDAAAPPGGEAGPAPDATPIDAALIDAAPIDALIDAAPAPVTKYDIAYITDITLNPNISSIFSFLLIVNKGTAPLKLETTTVVTYSDDSAGIDWTLTNNGVTTTMLRPDHAAGMLSPDVAAKLVDSGLVPEPIDDNTLNFTMAFTTPPPSGVTLRAQAVLRVETADIVLPFTINIVASGAPKYNVASRISSQN
jgi:hypothetical protein